METSFIQVYVQRNEIGNIEARNYTLIGKSPYVYISRDMENVGAGQEVMSIGPYKLILIEENPASGSYLYVRKGWLGAARVFLYKITRITDLVYRRIILTMAVWGMAEVGQGRIPSIKDVYIVKRFVKTGKRSLP